MSDAAPTAARPLSLGELVAVAIGALAALIAASIALQPVGLAGVPLVTVIGLMIPALLIGRQSGGVIVSLGLTRPRPSALIGALLIGSSLWLLEIALLGPLLATLPDRETTEAALAPLVDGTTPLALRLTAFALLPALSEELLCRGVLCRHLAVHLGAPAAVAASAAYFAALHVSFSQGIPALVTGLALGAVALGARSTLAAIALHLVHNAWVLVAADRSTGLGDLLASAPLVAIPAAAGATAIGFALVRGSRSAPG